SFPKRPTYARDVAPIVNTHCVSCHRQGAIAPFSLATYDEVQKKAGTIASVTKSRYMPPWHPEPGYGTFRDERRLSEREIAVLAAWKDAGTPEGDAKDLPTPPVFTTAWELGEPDLVLTLPTKFDVPAAGRDIFRAFVLPHEFLEDKEVAGI